MRRKAMAQSMDAMAMRDAGGPLRVIVDFLGGADGHRRVGIEARKHPRGWPVEVPVGAQFGQEAGGEERIAIRAPFAPRNTEQTTLPFNIRELQTDDLTDAQARGIGRHEEDAVPGVLGAREQALKFLDTQDLGKLR